MNSVFQFSFFYYSIGICVILSFLFTIVSFLIVMQRLSFLAIGTEHAAFGGIGLAHVLQKDPLLTTMLFCSCLTIFSVRFHKKIAETSISLFFSGAMAFGMILLSLKGGAPFNFMGFLFGDLINITLREFLIATIITLCVGFTILPSLPKIIFLIFDRDMAVVSGLNEIFWDVVIYATLSVTIILGIKLVGILLVSAMTVLPVSFGILWEKDVFGTLIISFFFTLTMMILGVLISCFFDLSPGSLIVILSVIIYFASRIFLAISQYGRKKYSNR